MPPPPAAPRARLAAVDLLRGLVMVLMALDHARDFYGDIRLVPDEVATTTPLLFATRWVTHFCAPVFVALAGASAWLWQERGRSMGELSRFLWTRGAWLVALEFTLVAFGWTLSLALRLVLFQVIAAIGCGMIALGCVARLPRGVVAAIGLALVAGHDALAGVDAEGVAWPTAWTLLLEPGLLTLAGGLRVNVLYPILPWTGVLLLGWCMGPWMKAPAARRRRLLFGTGLALTLAFVLLRATNLYGDPAPWSPQPEAWRSVVAFLACTKYPPSLCFLTMTLGPALMLLALLERPAVARALRPLEVYGRVPLFYYVVHLYLCSVGSALVYWLEDGRFLRLFPSLFGGLPADYGHGLGVVWLAWAAIVLALYLPCRAWGRLKRAGRSPLWIYL